MEMILENLFDYEMKSANNKNCYTKGCKEK